MYDEFLCLRKWRLQAEKYQYHKWWKITLSQNRQIYRKIHVKINTHQGVMVVRKNGTQSNNEISNKFRYSLLESVQPKIGAYKDLGNMRKHHI